MNRNEPLGLPRGSVRALLAIVIVGAGVAGMLMGRILPEWFLGILTLVLGLYFGGRSTTDTAPPFDERPPERRTRIQ